MIFRYSENHLFEKSSLISDIILAALILALSAHLAFCKPTDDVKVIPSIGYVSEHNWLAVPEGISDEEIKSMIGAEVSRILTDEGITRYTDATQIFQDWMMEKQDIMSKWRKKFLDLGSGLRDEVANLSRLSQEKISLEREIIVTESQVEAEREKLRADSSSMKSYEKEVEYLKGNFEVQLGDISYPVVVMGKRELGMDDDVRDVLDIISNRMAVEAIRDVNGTKIKAVKTVKNSQLISDLIQSVESGVARVVESYTNDFGRLGEDEITDYRYLIQTIEVSPFKSKGTGKESESVGGDMGKEKVYVISKENFEQIWAAEGLTDDRSKDKIREFVNWLLEQTERQAGLIEGKMAESYSDYQERVNQVQNTIGEIRTKLAKSTEKVAIKQRGLDSMRVVFNDYEKSIFLPAQEQLKYADALYQDHTRVRIIMADKTEEDWVKGQKPRAAYTEFASGTLDKLSEYKIKEYKKIAISVNYQLQNYEENLYSYKPNIRAFTILYLTKNNLSDNVSYIVSVAYQMQLTAGELLEKDYDYISIVKAAKEKEKKKKEEKKEPPEEDKKKKDKKKEKKPEEEAVAPPPVF
ncbi:MAG: hypothetical protein HQ591_02150 [candidate division Zixibacteria bacterium]|nr:hypothetical protein [Candidatus Tariuqbacter arcticus]